MAFMLTAAAFASSTGSAFSQEFKDKAQTEQKSSKPVEWSPEMKMVIDMKANTKAEPIFMSGIMYHPELEKDALGLKAKISGYLAGQNIPHDILLVPFSREVNSDGTPINKGIAFGHAYGGTYYGDYNGHELIAKVKAGAAEFKEKYPYAVASVPALPTNGLIASNEQ